MKVNEWLNSELALNIWKRKYQYEDESFDKWLSRVSGHDAEMKRLILDKKFLFAGRILSNRGLQHQGVKCTFSNCYVLEQPKDNIEDIYDTAKKLARTFSYGGGVGIDLAKLRPRNAKVNNSARITTGAVSFMPTYSEVTGTIGQNNRRGALMISMPVNHPDIEEFIDIKRDLDKVTKANISVRVTKDFMRAVKANLPYSCTFQVEDTGEYIEKIVDARKLFMRLCENNWDYAEPGILYWDRIEKWNIVSEYENFKYSGVNPCAEEPLPAGGSCLLGSLNLSEFVVKPFNRFSYFDWKEFRRAIKIAVRGLNEVLDEGLELHPLEIQRETVRDWRQIGLGVMGIADMLVKLNLEYGSDASIKFCEQVAKMLADESLRASSELAKEYGTFPMYDKDATLNSPYVQAVCSEETLKHIEEHGLRNSQILTIAPTGTLSTMLEISGGIEPIFNTSYVRKTESLGDGDQYYKVYTPIIKQYMEFHNITDEEDIPDSVKVTAMNLDPINRIYMQGIWQDYIDASISSTVNLPNEATIDDVYEIYMSAFNRGLKGITVFRDGCQRSAILTNTVPKKEEKKEDQEMTELLPSNDLARGEKKEIAEDTMYFKKPVNIGCGKLNLFIGYSPSEATIQDLYIKKSGNGGCEKNLETTVIGMSLVLRLGGSLEMVEKAFSGISTCSSFTSAKCKGKEVSKGAYCGSAIMNILKDFMNEMTGEKINTINNVLPKKVEIPMEKIDNKAKCPECEAEVNMTEGCMTCPSCGYSKCS